jgi:UPF0755 protein
MTRQKKRKKLKKILAAGFIILLFAASVAFYLFYHYILEPNLSIRQPTHFYIPTGSSFEDVRQSLVSDGLIKHARTFEWVAAKKNYPNRVLPGRYLLTPDMGNNTLVNLLRSGRQDPVNITFNNIRTKQQLAAIISNQLEADSTSVMALFSDRQFLQDYGMVPETAILLFIPNTYEFFWNTSATQLFDRMHREYKRFWNDHRLDLAGKTGLTPLEVMILASIVQRETSKADEMSTIAGVYLNRLRRNMLLQADPTVVFAVGDFSITRVLNRHLAVDSPYNTYKYPGLPPGPIGLPEPQATDRVLNYKNHDYLFFCAKDDFSGYHAFAKTYPEHLANARRYHRALNLRQIMN